MRSKAIAAKVIKFVETLTIPEGPKANQRIKLAPYQKAFIRGSMAPDVSVGILSIARGNGKSALSASIALGELLGVWDDQPRREIIIAARTAEQARVAFNFILGFVHGLSPEIQEQIRIKKSPRLEMHYDGDNGGHVIKAIASDGRSSLGGAPNLVIMDERSAWRDGQGEELEHALMSGLGKRSGRALIISTSADSDSHPFSVWLDNPQPGIFIQEHRSLPGLPADDVDSLKAANPGADVGIGASIEWLQAQAKRAIARGGSTLSTFRLYNRNERISPESRDVLLSVDEFMDCETADLPPRAGSVIVGIDLGGSASMSACSFYWPETGRLESLATFPTVPTLAHRGASDGVGTRYVEMQERGELQTLGEKTVPVAPWLRSVMQQVEGEHVEALIADRYRQSELGDAIEAAGIKMQVIWRGTGWKDGGEDCERFRRAAYDGLVKTAPSLLLRSAFADAVVLRDPANNLKLAKGRSNGRIDAVSASVLAVAEGVRRTSRPMVKRRVPTWV